MPSTGARAAAWELSPCLEWLYADGGRPFAERVRSAARGGFARIEFWGTEGKDLTALEAAIRETGVTVDAFVSEPAGRIVDRATHDAFLTGVDRSCRLAGRLNARGVIVLAGDSLPDAERGAQREAVVIALRRAAPVAAAAGIELLLEPLNTKVDHRGHFLDSTAEALHIVREVNAPSVRLLYDMYHSIVMGEDPASVLGASGHLVGHVHLADVPGRHEPGTGEVDWPRQLAALRAAGYSGSLGLEYMPARSTDSSTEFIRQVVDGLR